jgi:hypothetical protein
VFSERAPDASISGDSSDYSEEDVSLFGMQDSSDDELPSVAMSPFGLLWTTLDSWKTPATISFLHPHKSKKDTPVPEDDECILPLSFSLSFLLSVPFSSCPLFGSCGPSLAIALRINYNFVFPKKDTDKKISMFV